MKAYKEDFEYEIDAVSRMIRDVPTDELYIDGALVMSTFAQLESAIRSGSAAKARKALARMREVLDETARRDARRKELVTLISLKASIFRT